MRSIDIKSKQTITKMSSVSVPSTPKNDRKQVISKTPRTTIKRQQVKKTILNANFDESYVEDETYINDTTILSESDNEDVVEDDFVQELREKEVKAANSECKYVAFVKKHEIGRKIFHSSIGFFTLYMYTLGITHHQFILPLTLLFIGVFINDFIRLRNPKLNRKITGLMWFLIRDSEINSYNGVLYYLAGLILVFSIFPKDISFISVLFLSWADTAASTFGRLYGKYTPKIGRHKSLAGSIASFVTGVAVIFLIYKYLIPNYPVNGPNDIFYIELKNKLSFTNFAIISGLIASFAEVVNVFGIDDNFTIPVLSSILIWGLIKLTQY